MKKDIYVVGDIHGKFRKLVWEIVERNKLTNSIIFVTGDCGVGFDNSIKFDYKKTEKKLEKSNIIIYYVRGNHDNPIYFDGEHDFPRLKFAKDYELIDIDGFTIYPIGGAVSTDKDWRIEENKKYPENRKIWWENEDITRIEKITNDRVDLVISHESPNYFEPMSIRTSEISENVYKEIQDSRNYLNKIVNQLGDNCRYWIFGHYHKSYLGTYGNILYRGLNIFEFYKINN